LSSFWFKLKQQWTIEEISIFSNSSHLQWGQGCRHNYVIWFGSFRRKDLNVIFYQNMPNLHNLYKSAERKISQKNPEYKLLIAM
jgi:hypothetical protein